jgi:UDP-glucose 4-epimerase
MVDKKIFKTMKAIVFGGSGFLGSHVAEELARRNYEVTVVDRNKIVWSEKKIKFIKSDILNYKKLSKIIKKNTIVYNFAAIADIGDSYKNPLKTIEINILGNSRILALCAKNKVKKYIFASTIYVYSQQGGFYRASKQSAEILIEEFNRVYKIPYVILRYGSIYGLRTNLKNGLYKIVYDALNLNKLIYRGTKKAIRSYIHVNDAAKISVDVLQKKFENNRVLVSGNSSIKIISLLKILGKILKIKSNPLFLNQTQKGHYDKSPYSTKKEKSFNFVPKKPLGINEGLKNLIEDIKSKIKTR